MRIAVYSNIHNARQGGGVLYIASLAAALAQKHDVELFFRDQINPSEIEQFLPVPLSGMKTDLIARPGGLSWFTEIKEVLTNNYDMIVAQSTHISRLQHARNTVLVCEFPLQKTPRLSERGRLRIIRAIIANSAFTAGWIERRWGRKAEVLYPAVFPVAPLTKEPWILAVGRFVAGKRSKHQLEMIAMFRELVEQGLTGWQLHIAGMAQDEEYCERVRETADGLPVFLHFNASRIELEKLYGKASIFWHAAGAACDRETEPEFMEHFGIATAEAMSAGAIPVVINRGGQPEVIGETGGGILWDTFAQCKESTSSLINDGAKRIQMSQIAVERASAFSFPAFARRVHELFNIA